MAIRANKGHFEAGKFKQKIKITMIDISCKFYEQKLHDKYILYESLVEAIIGHQKFLQSSAFRVAYRVALSYHVKIRENY